MRARLIVSIVSSLMLAATVLPAQQDAAKKAPVTDVSVSIRMRPTPVFQNEVVAPKEKGAAKRGTPKSKPWLVAEVSFIVAKPAKGTGSAWFDNLSVELSVLVPSVVRDSGTMKVVPMLLTGVQSLDPVMRDGQVHKVLFLVPSHVLFRNIYVPSAVTDDGIPDLKKATTELEKLLPALPAVAQVRYDGGASPVLGYQLAGRAFTDLVGLKDFDVKDKTATAALLSSLLKNESFKSRSKTVFLDIDSTPFVMENYDGYEHMKKEKQGN